TNNISLETIINEIKNINGKLNLIDAKNELLNEKVDINIKSVNANLNEKFNELSSNHSNDNKSGAGGSFIKKYSKTSIALSALFGIIIGNFFDYNREQDARLENELSETIIQKDGWTSSVSERIMQMRRTNDLIRLKCKFGNPLPPYEQAELRLNQRYNLLETAVVRSHYTFYSLESHDAIRNIIALENSINDVCNEEAPTDAKYQEQMVRFRELMVGSIEHDIAERNRLNQGFIRKFFNYIGL
ncbi:MAG: hypothetical protein ACFFD1_05990, partial [Candidatus Thorarchaeota archaeon]